jgi:thiol-disulfide isomerase/thioredoxin
MVTLQAAMMAMLLSNPGQIELLDFYADWCAPCRAMQPTIQALEAKGYPVKKVNIAQNHELTAQYGVQSVPCYVLVVDGKEVERLSGGTSYSRLEKMFKTAAGPSSPANNNLPNKNLPGGAPSTFAPNEGATRNPSVPGGAVTVPPAGVFSDPNVTPANGVMPMAGMQNRQAPPPAANFNLPGEQTSAAVSDAQLIAASVRIRVADPSGHSCGSGTIIDARGGKALVLTCGHLFRDSQGKGKIEVELFGPHAGEKVEGRLESYDAETRDVGLVSIQMTEPIVALRLAPVGYNVRGGDAVASVGCDHGADPTVRKNHQVIRVNPENLWVNDPPTDGRSGGGLFSAEGYVIGLAKGHDESGREGCYPNLEQIHAQLDQVGLSFVYQSPQGWGKTAAISPSILFASNNVPAMPAEMPGMNELNPLAGASGGKLSNSAAATPAPLPAGAFSGLNPGEQAALEEIHRHLKDGAEVVCVIRPRNAPGAKSEVIMIDKASPELVRQLSAEAQGKDGVQPTSMEVARPRKKLLEWSIAQGTLQTAP